MVGNIIVFTEAPNLSVNSGIWFLAHEVQHTVQYEEWDFLGFAARYVKNWQAVEADADRKGDEAVAKNPAPVPLS